MKHAEELVDRSRIVSGRLNGRADVPPCQLRAEHDALVWEQIVGKHFVREHSDADDAQSVCAQRLDDDVGRGVARVGFLRLLLNQ